MASWFFQSKCVNPIRTSCSFVLVSTFDHVPTTLTARRERSAACEGCSVPDTCVKGLPQSQYDARAVRWSCGAICQSPRPRKLFWTVLVSKEND